MSVDKTLAQIDALLGTIDHQYQCGCGKWHQLRPDTSRRAKVDCPCGARREFNLAQSRP